MHSVRQRIADDQDKRTRHRSIMTAVAVDVNPGERKEDPSSPTPTPSPSPSDGADAGSNASWALAWIAVSVASTSSQPTLATKKRAKKTQICRDVEDLFLFILFGGGGIFLTPLPSQSKKWIDAAV